METEAGKLVYRITADSANLKKGLNESSKGMHKLTGTAKSTGAMISRFLGAGAMALLGKKLVGLGSDAQELGNKFSVVFKGAEKTTNVWIKQYTDAVGRGDMATREYLATLQDIRTGFGDTAPEAARFSEAIVGITNDLSSFSNTSFEETSAAIQSGLSGQFEALRRLGVGLNVAIINQGEYAAALGKTWQEMDNLEKQEAVLSGIVEQSSNALGQTISDWRDYDYRLGDAAKTSDSVANRTKAMQQSLADVGASFGTVLLPYVSDFLGAALDLLSWAEDLSPAMKELSIGIAALAASFLTGGWIGVAVAAVAGIALKMSDARDRSDELKEATDQLKKATGEYQAVAEELAGDISGLTDLERELLKTRKEIAILETKQALRAFIAEEALFRKQQERTGAEIEQNKEVLKVLEEIEWVSIHAIEQEITALKRKIDFRRDEIATEKQISTEELTRLNVLTRATAIYHKGDEQGLDAKRKLIQNILGLEQESLGLEVQRKESINALAGLHNDNLITLSEIAAIDRGIADEVARQAQELAKTAQAEKDAADAAADAAKQKREAARLTEETARTEEEAAKEKQEQAEQNAALLDEYKAKLKLLKADEIERLELMKEQAIVQAIAVGATPETLETIDTYYRTLIANQREANIGTDEYRSKLEQLSMTQEEAIRAEWNAAVTRAKANGAQKKDLEAINSYYRKLIEKLKETSSGTKTLKEILAEWDWQDWANNAASAIGQVGSLFSSIGNLISAIADQQIAAVDAQMQAELQALGLVEDAKVNRYSKERKRAEEELADLEKDAKNAANIEKKNEIEKAAAEKAIELDKLQQDEANEAKRLAIEERYEQKKARMKYQASLSAWELNVVAAIAQAAMAALSGLTAAPWPLGLVMGPLAAALGAIQVATVVASRPQPPSFDAGAWNIPQDMQADIHRGEMILPAPFADSVRSGEATVGGGASPVYVSIYSNENVETEETKNTDGAVELRVFVGHTVREQWQEGQFDGLMVERYGIVRRGRP